MNLYNAALVTPTYYVYFTSAVIVTSAVLFQGFKGTPIEITTVVMGFLQICSGVVLLQLSKSAKDVPDTAVFAGDLDQMRTVAEQEEPEYEPRADTIRGGGAIIRSISKVRQSRQMQEIDRLREEHMEPIGENEQVEFDGLRRRRTILAPGQFPSSPASISRRKSVHPPLGMSHFPTEDELAEEDLHPGIFHWRKTRDRSSTATESTATAVPLSPMKASSEPTIVRTDSQGLDPSAPHTYGLPASLHQDTAYRSGSYAGQGAGHHIQFASQDPRSGNKGLTPPPPVPPHKDAQKRQFSFQNVFHPGSRGPASPSQRPVSRGALSFASRRSTSNRQGNGDGTTEEERLGLVKGDSQTSLQQGPFGESPPSYSSASDEEAAYDDNSLPSGREVEARNRSREERERRRPPRIDAARANRSGSESEVERLPSAKRLGRGSGSSDGSADGRGGRG